MRRRAAALLFTAGALVSAVVAVRQGKDWAARPTSPLLDWGAHLASTLPTDARILLLVPESDRFSSQVCMLNTALHPRACYLLPPGTSKLEDASDWIAAKRLTWALSLGGPAYDPARAWVRPLNDRR